MRGRDGRGGRGAGGRRCRACERGRGGGAAIGGFCPETGTFYGMKMTAGHIYRVAGDGRTGSGGDGGPATAAPLDLAGSAVPDGAGNLVIGDGTRVRVVAARTGTFYGQQMTAGGIYTVAGNGTAFSGDGGLPLRAEFSNPTGVSADQVLSGDDFGGFRRRLGRTHLRSRSSLVQLASWSTRIDLTSLPSRIHLTRFLALLSCRALRPWRNPSAVGGGSIINAMLTVRALRIAETNIASKVGITTPGLKYDCACLI